MYAKRFILCAAVLFGPLACAPVVRADSLFPVKAANQALRGSTSASAAALFADTRAHAVGDVLTITIAENTSASSTANTKTARSEDVSAFAGTGLVTRLFRDLALTANSSRKSDGSGSTTRSGSLVTTLSVLVKEVLPNNTLKIEGSRLVGINREAQRVTFSGIVRPEDIGPDNSVASNLVASVEVRYDGKGVVGEAQHPGLFARVFHFLFF